MFGDEVSNPTEGEQALVDALEAHAAEAHPSGAAFVLCKDELIGRERYAATIDKRHEGSGWPVLHDRQTRHMRTLLVDAASRHELDEAEDG